MWSISRDIMLIVIDRLGGTHTHTDIHIETILRNQVCACCGQCMPGLIINSESHYSHLHKCYTKSQLTMLDKQLTRNITFAQILVQLNDVSRAVARSSQLVRPQLTLTTMLSNAWAGGKFSNAHNYGLLVYCLCCSKSIKPKNHLSTLYFCTIEYFV